MNYWWVNQNQTYRHEAKGGYIWSPKRNANGAKNHFYDVMKEVAPGDIIFSFKDTLIFAIGIANSYCSESPKPPEFVETGPNWSNIGWKVNVHFNELSNKIRPKDFIEQLRGYLPAKYSPLQLNGNGLQSVYLTHIGSDFAEKLLELIGSEVIPLQEAAKFVKPLVSDDIELWEYEIEKSITVGPTVSETERQAIVLARVGQGVFKSRVGEIESRCRITGVENPAHLIASHCKPWRDSNNYERLNGENGLLLTPSIDHLFDRGFIGFESNGDLIISPVADRASLARMGIETNRLLNVGHFTEGQKGFLEFHRNEILLIA